MGAGTLASICATCSGVMLCRMVSGASNGATPSGILQLGQTNQKQCILMHLGRLEPTKFCQGRRSNNIKGKHDWQSGGTKFKSTLGMTMLELVVSIDITSATHKVHVNDICNNQRPNQDKMMGKENANHKHTMFVMVIGGADVV
jgi:hypothetical protein